MLKPEVLPGIGAVKGYKGSYLLRRNAGDEIEFVTIILWDSPDAIRAVAGTDVCAKFSRRRRESDPGAVTNRCG